jgi:3-dehydroquinate synthase
VREAVALQEALTEDRVVISAGGGAAVFHDGMAKMRAAATVLWLDAPPEVLVERTLRDGDRPLLGDSKQAQLAALQTQTVQRNPVYAQAHLRIDARGTLDQVAREAQAALAPVARLPVQIEGTRHDVVIHAGHACDAAEEIAALAPGAKVALLVDAKVQAQAEPLQAMLQARGMTVIRLDVAGGERCKDVRTAARLWQDLAEHGVDRGDLLVALGGGAITDLGGFVAATWQRGMRVVLIPTTVLAMADASIGGKTAVNLALGKNLAGGKNLVGALHPPALVWLPLGALATLPSREFRAGLAEIAKVFACLDRPAWDALIADAPHLRKKSLTHLKPHLQRAIELKAQIVTGDPREEAHLTTQGMIPRAILNFGHTLGHALEAESAFALRHGEAVALGMVAAAELSEAMGQAPAGTVGELRAGLQALDLPTRYETHLTEAVLARLAQDKKRRGETLALVTLAGIGRAQVSPCRVTQLVAMIRVLGVQAAPVVPGR